MVRYPRLRRLNPARRKVHAVTEREYYWILNCPCGESLEGSSEDQIVDLSFAHLRDKHPDMADTYEREHILFMAQRFVRT